MTVVVELDICQEIQVVRDMFMDAIRVGSASLAASVYAPSAQIFPPGAEPLLGLVAIEGFWQALIALGMVDVSVDVVELDIKDDTAIELGHYAYYDRSGKTADWGTYLLIWKKCHGEWKMYRDMWSGNHRMHREVVAY